MDASIALLLALVGGFQFVETCRYTKFVSAREEGHRLYFRAAFWAALLFALVAVLLHVAHLVAAFFHWAVAIETAIVGSVSLLLKDSNNSIAAQASVVIASVLTMFSGKPVALLANHFGRRGDDEVLADALGNDEFEQLLIDASLLTKQIMVSLSNSKVYVGIPLGNPDPKRDRKVIVVLPVMSGYRDEAQKVVFTTFYDELIRRSDAIEDDLRVAIPLDKVVSIAYFDLETYAAFQRRGPASSQSEVAEAI